MERDKQLDNIKGLLIILVVFGHALELLRVNSLLSNYIYNFIYSFHMPVFIFLSGYLAKNVSKGRENAFKQYFIPFLLFNSIWNFIQVITTSMISIPVDSPVAFSFLNPGWALWYILAMFIWKSLLPDLLKIKNIFRVVLVVGILSRLFSEFNVFLSLSRLLVFTPYFVGGFLFSKESLERVRKSRLSISIILLLISLAFNYFFLFHTTYPTEFLWADRPFSFFSNSLLVSICLGIALYIVGFSFVIIFLRLMTKKETFLTKIGINSFPVYILHTYLVGGISFFILNVNEYLQLVLLLLISIVLSILLSRNIVNNKFNKLLQVVNNFLYN